MWFYCERGRSSAGWLVVACLVGLLGWSGFRSLGQSATDVLVDGAVGQSTTLPPVGSRSEAAGWQALVRQAVRAGRGLGDRTTSGMVGAARRALRKGEDVRAVASRLGESPADRALAEALGKIDEVENEVLQEALVRAATLSKVGEVSASLEILEQVRRTNRTSRIYDITEQLEEVAFAFGPEGARSLARGATRRYRHWAESQSELIANVHRVRRNPGVLADADQVLSRERLARLPYLSGDRRLRRLYIQEGQIPDFQKFKPGEIEQSDVVVIGGGFHGSVAARAFADVDPNIRVVVLESSDKISATFLEGGQGVFSNSKTFPNTGLTISDPVLANRNAVPGASVQVSDLSPLRNPQIRVFGEAASDVLQSSNAAVVFNAPVTLVEDLADGTSLVHYADDKTIRTRKVIAATGLGVPRTRVGDRFSQQLIATDVSKFDLLLDDEFPAIWTATDFRKWFDNADAPRRAFNDLDTVLVVGAGDSSWTVAEAILGMAPEEIYGPGLEGFRQPKKIIIATTPDGPSNLDEFLGVLQEASGSTPTTRDRYGRLLNAIRTMEIEFVPEYAVNFRSSRTTKTRNGVSWRPVEAYLSADSAAGLRKAKSIEVDRVVLSIGFDNRIDKVFAGQLKAGERVRDQPRIRGRIEGWDKLAYLGRRIGKNATVVGPTAGNDIVPRHQYAPFAVNDASIFNRGARTRAAATRVAQELVEEGELLGAWDFPTSPRQALSTRGSLARDLRLRRSKAIQKVELLPEDELLSLRLASVVDSFTYRGIRKLKIEFERTQSGLQLRANVGDQLLADAIEADRELLWLLDRASANGRRLEFSWDLRSQVGEPGTIRHYTLSR